MSTICFYAQFTASKVGVNSLTVTWDIERITRSDGTRSALVTGGANGITVGRRGLYGYVLTGADLLTYDYVATAITATTTVDLQEVPALWTFWALSWHDIATSILTVVGSFGKLIADFLDVAVSSRLSTAGYTAPDNASITAIKAKTDNLPTDPADESLLEAAISAIPAAPSVAAIDAQLSGTHGAGSWLTGGTGSGSVAYDYIVTNSATLSPLPDVEVSVYSDSGLNTLIGAGTTDAFGTVRFYLDPGTYYFVSRKSGYTFTNPDIETVV